MFERKEGLQSKVRRLDVTSIQPNPWQPRQTFQQAELEELAQSIAENGILQPLTVRHIAGKWQLIAGERRLRAAQMAGLKQVPCVELMVDDEKAAVLALLENLQRQDLNFFEEAEAIAQLMEEHFSIPRRESAAAAKAAYAAYDAYVHDVRETGMKYIRHARDHHMPILVACGRPYHIDPEINHGINDLITSFGFVLVTEDALSYLEGYAPRKVLNQWTFQSRMYNAARYVCTQPDMQVVQLVSFGCGTDAITTDEMRSILEDGDKLYTQLKIDDISNLGAVKIRIRSLMAAIDARKEN